jgi:hypothetical protein
LLFITGKAKNMQSELSTEIVATADRTEKVAGETAEVAGDDSKGSKSGKKKEVAFVIFWTSSWVKSSPQSSWNRQKSKLLPSST